MFPTSTHDRWWWLPRCKRAPQAEAKPAAGLRVDESTPPRPPQSSALPANLGRLDGQVRAAWDPACRADERLLLKCLERLGVVEGSRVCGRHPHHAGEVGQRHAAVEGARLSGEGGTVVAGKQNCRGADCDKHLVE